jgi:shikimate kinase
VRIALTGFMGAGKSTVGRLLAGRLRLDFVDLDDEVERTAERSIREIFVEAGEGGFRQLERGLLAEVLSRENVVVALGGGTLTDADQLALAKSRAVVVWLNPKFATLIGRIGPLGKTDRPLFRDETAAFDLYRRRLPFYRASDLRIDVAADESAAEVAARIALELARSTCSS